MKIRVFLSAVSAACLTVTATGMEYPETATVEHTDTYHGQQVADPYRWLELDVRESDQVANWVGTQNQTTSSYLETLSERAPIRERLTQLWNYERYGISPPRHTEHFFEHHGGHYYSFRNDGLQNQSVLYVQDSLDGNPRVLIDPNTWSEDGTLALASVVFSPDGRYMAYGIQDSGSDWRTWRVLDLNSNKLLDDKLEWLKFTSVSWLPDGSGFYYSRYPKPKAGEEFTSLNHNQTVYFHKIGTDQSADPVVLQRPDHPEWGFNAQVTQDGHWLVVQTWAGTDDRYRIDVIDLTSEEQKVMTLVDDFVAAYDLVGSDRNVLYFRTTQGAPRARLISWDLSLPQSEQVKELVAESNAVLTNVNRVGGRFVAHYLRDAHSQVKVFNAQGDLEHEVKQPGIGSADGFEGSNDSTETFYHFSSFNQPPSIYRYDVATNESTLIASSKVDFDPERYVVRQVFYPSKDGTRIPMFIVQRKDLQLDGSNPTLLYGYGGFNISLTPGFDPSRIGWLEMGGVYAVANMRGGGEYGEEWHKAGTKTQKQNVFDDFIAAAEYLISERYTSPDHLAIYGRSNGGLLIGATLNQRPDLFAAGLPQVGVMDMLRFQEFTAGRFWTDDYGASDSDDPEEYKALRAYSPYHNIREDVAYPAVLVTTGDTDDRVVPGHSFKYIARLQKAQPEGAPPTLIRIDTNAGHADGKPTEMIIAEYADMWAFIARHTGLKLSESFLR